MIPYLKNLPKPEINFLSVEDIKNIHTLLIQRYGGSDGIRDTALLEAAVMQPQSTFCQNFLHSTIFKMAAAYSFHIIKNHSFIDGNKRTGILAAIIFLERNGFILESDFDSLYQLAIEIANSQLAIEDIADFFEQSTHRKLNR